MKVWLKFMAYVVGSFSAVLTYQYFHLQWYLQEQQAKPPVQLEQPVSPEPLVEAEVETETEAMETRDAPDTQDFIANLPQILPSETESTDDGTYIIHGDNHGHFRGRALINGISMPYVIDTGATTTTIPAKLAKQANLPMGEQRMVETANGITTSQQSKIKELRLGNAVLKDIDADINFTLEEVLIGMTALKHFQISLESNTLKLTPNKGYTDDSVSLTSQAKNWKKNTVCDSEGLNCKTVYGPAD